MQNPDRRRPLHNYFYRLEKRLRRHKCENELNNSFINDEIIENNVLLASNWIKMFLLETFCATCQFQKKHNFKSFEYNLTQYLFEGDFED